MSYQVRSGDTLSAIAKRYGVSLAALEHANPQLQDPNTRAVAADKKAIQADAKLAKADKQRALKELLPAEYKLGLARTNKDRKALGLKAVKKAIRPKGPVAPKGFKALTPAQFK